MVGCISVERPGGYPISKKTSPQYWLKSSVFAGNFYDDDQTTLIDTRPFSAINDATTIDGYNLFPPAPNHIIPAGTLVEITAVSYPTAQEKFKRPIYSPRDNIWVFFRIAKERGQVSIFRPKPHVLIIPLRYSTEEQVKTYLKNYLSIKDPNMWILKEASHIQEAIWRKRPVIGMNKPQLEACLGPALKKQYTKDPDENEQQELWHYDDYFIALKKDLVIKVKKLSDT